MTWFKGHKKANKPSRSDLAHGVKDPIIRLAGVTKNYSTAGEPMAALQDINLEIFPGEFVGIFGKSGAGKTTLVNMVTGVDHPTAGEIWVDGVPVHALDENRLAFWRGRNLGIVYQSFHLMPSLSLVNNVMLPMDFTGLFQSNRSAERALELLREVEIDEHAGKLPADISGGQQQRVAIARALANDPPVIIADEPTGRLDSATAETVFQVFLSLIQQGKTILMVTHDRSLASRVSRSLVLVDGRLQDSGESLAGNGRREETNA